MAQGTFKAISFEEIEIRRGMVEVKYGKTYYEVTFDLVADERICKRCGLVEADHVSNMALGYKMGQVINIQNTITYGDINPNSPFGRRLVAAVREYVNDNGAGDICSNCSRP